MTTVDPVLEVSFKQILSCHKAVRRPARPSMRDRLKVKKRLSTTELDLGSDLHSTLGSDTDLKSSPTPLSSREFNIRRATEGDLDSTVYIEVSSGHSAPIISIPWSNYEALSKVFKDRHRFVLNHPDEWQLYVATQRKSFQEQDSVEPFRDGMSGQGVLGEVIIGFIIGHKSRKELVSKGKPPIILLFNGQPFQCKTIDTTTKVTICQRDLLTIKQEEEWQPPLPPGSNATFISSYVSHLKTIKDALQIKKYWELDTICVSIPYQRMGIGGSLIRSWLKNDVESSAENDRTVYVMSSAEGKGLYKRLGWREMNCSDGTGKIEDNMEGKGRMRQDSGLTVLRGEDLRMWSASGPKIWDGGDFKLWNMIRD